MSWVEGQQTRFHEEVPDMPEGVLLTQVEIWPDGGVKNFSILGENFVVEATRQAEFLVVTGTSGKRCLVKVVKEGELYYLENWMEV